MAYDWHLLQFALPAVYEHADVICLSLDKDRIGWAGQKFSFDDKAFFRFVEQIDVGKKVKLYEDDFHIPELSPMQNEVRQRNFMAEYLGLNGWHVQLDADEYFVDFARFVTKLRSIRTHRKINVCVPLLILFKQVSKGFLIINYKGKNGVCEFAPIATNAPAYQYGRGNGYSNYYVDDLVLHQSWARDEEEIKQKTANWGHKNDFNVQHFFERWKTLTGDNYQDYRNFHPMRPDDWSSLKLLPYSEIPEVLDYCRNNPPFRISKSFLQYRNSLFVSRVKKLMRLGRRK